MYTILKTDQYKFAMAEAGWPLQEETFYYTHRKGGPHYLPVDVKEYIKNLFKNWKQDPEAIRKQIKESSGLNVGDWMTFFASHEDPFSLLQIRTLPKGSWFLDKAPAFTVTGPSFLVSWLEPQILRLNFEIQVATLAKLDHKAFQRELNTVSTNDEYKIVAKYRPLDLRHWKPTVETVSYWEQVKERAETLLNLVDGDSSRLFEVGMRAARTESQHQMALLACKEAGLNLTSNTFAASLLAGAPRTDKDLKAVGTMGHEHVQRFFHDEIAFSSMAKRLSGSVFCLVDTHDAMNIGIPKAIELMKEQPERNHAIRFDSGNIENQLKAAARMNPKGRFCLEDGWNAEKTEHFELIRKDLGLKPHQVLYGYGGFLVRQNWSKITRDRVAAVWKMTKTDGWPTMKISNAGKQSLPGEFVLWCDPTSGHQHVYQIGEKVPNGLINGYSGPPIMKPDLGAQLWESPATMALMKEIKEDRFDD